MFAKKRYTLLPLYRSTRHFPPFWVKEPRHSETISAKKRYTLIPLYRSTRHFRRFRVKEVPVVQKTFRAKRGIYLSIVARVNGRSLPSVVGTLFGPNGLSKVLKTNFSSSPSLWSALLCDQSVCVATWTLKADIAGPGHVTGRTFLNPGKLCVDSLRKNRHLARFRANS